MRGRGDRVGGRPVVHFSKPRPDVRVYVLGLLGRRRQSCADGPHWLVCDDDLAHFLLGHSRKSLSHVQHPAHSMPQAQHQAYKVYSAHQPSPLPLLTISSYRAATAAKLRGHAQPARPASPCRCRLLCLPRNRTVSPWPAHELTPLRSCIICPWTLNAARQHGSSCRAKSQVPCHQRYRYAGTGGRMLSTR
jgi:hypothetical protein